MAKGKFKLIDLKYIDMRNFQMWEGKFLDEEQEGREIYIYANVSNFDTPTFEESEVRIYAHSFEDLYCPDEYELYNFDNETEEYLKSVLLSVIKQNDQAKGDHAMINMTIKGKQLYILEGVYEINGNYECDENIIMSTDLEKMKKNAKKMVENNEYEFTAIYTAVYDEKYEIVDAGTRVAEYGTHPYDIKNY